MLHLWPQLHREPGPFVWSASACGSCVPDFGSRMGRTFRTGLQTETVSRIRRSEWDAFSGRGLKWKVCPGIWLQPGMHFPVEASTGSCVPESCLRMERAFRWRGRWENTAQIGGGMRSGDARPSSSYRSTSLSHVGRAVCRMPAVCSFLASIPAERTSFMVKRSRGWP